MNYSKDSVPDITHMISIVKQRNSPKQFAAQGRGAAVQFAQRFLDTSERQRLLFATLRRQSNTCGAAVIFIAAR